MKFKELRRHWEEFGRTDPLFAAVSHPGKEGGRWDPDEFLETGRKEIAELMAHVEELGGCDRGTALDFGCGLGRLTQALAEHFDSVVGVDVASSMLEGAEELNRHGSKCRFVLNDAEDLGIFDDACFDLVSTNIVLQHMEPRYALRYVNEFFRVANPGGIVAFQVPKPVRYQRLKLAIPEPVLAAARRLRGHRGPAMQMFGLRDSEVRQAVRAHGAVVLRATAKDSSPSFPGTLYICRKAG